MKSPTIAQIIDAAESELENENRDRR